MAATVEARLLHVTIVAPTLKCNFYGRFAMNGQFYANRERIVVSQLISESPAAQL